MAVAYWNLVLSGRFKFLDLWNRFLLVSQRREIRDAQSSLLKFVNADLIKKKGVGRAVTDQNIIISVKTNSDILFAWISSILCVWKTVFYG